MYFFFSPFLFLGISFRFRFRPPPFLETRPLPDLFLIYIKSSSQSSPRSWLLAEAIFSSENSSSYAWSFCHFFSCLSLATLASSFFCSATG